MPDTPDRGVCLPARVSFPLLHRTMKLYFAPQSPFARKVRIAAIELGLEQRIDLLYTEVVPGQPNLEFGGRYNPLRKIPTMETDEGATLYDSTVICEYLESLSEQARLLPPAGPRRWRVLTNHALAQGMCESAISLRYESWLRPEALRWPEWMTDQWDKIDSGLQWFDEHPEELVGNPDLAQIALGCVIGYLDFRWPGRTWDGERAAPEVSPGDSLSNHAWPAASPSEGLRPGGGWRERYPALAVWYERIAERPSFTSTAPHAPPVF